MGDFNRLPDKWLRAAHKLRESIPGLNLYYMGDYYQTPCHLAPVGMADHQVIVCAPVPSYSLPTASKTTRIVRKLPVTKRMEFVTDIAQVKWEPLYCLEQCEQMYSFFISTILDLINKHFPLKQVSRSSSDKPLGK